MAGELTFTPSLSFKYTATTSSVATHSNPLGIPGNQTVIYNAGSVPVIIAFGDSTVVAVVPTTTPTAGRHAVAPGSTQTFTMGRSSHVAFITETSTADCYVSVGNGR